MCLLIQWKHKNMVNITSKALPCLHQQVSWLWGNEMICAVKQHKEISCWCWLHYNFEDSLWEVHCLLIYFTNRFLFWNICTPLCETPWLPTLMFSGLNHDAWCWREAVGFGGFVFVFFLILHCFSPMLIIVIVLKCLKKKRTLKITTSD